MASIKNLKKEINHVLGDVIGECLFVFTKIQAKYSFNGGALSAVSEKIVIKDSPKKCFGLSCIDIVRFISMVTLEIL